MSRSRSKGLGESRCCEKCGRCRVDEAGNYTCKGKVVIEGYMPSNEYYYCKGEAFKKAGGNDGENS